MELNEGLKLVFILSFNIKTVISKYTIIHHLALHLAVLQISVSICKLPRFSNLSLWQTYETRVSTRIL